jgi:hypothetical protein
LLFDGAGFAGGGGGGGAVPAETILTGKIITEAQTRTFLTSNINAPFQERLKFYQKSKFN